MDFVLAVPRDRKRVVDRACTLNVDLTADGAEGKEKAGGGDERRNCIRDMPDGGWVQEKSLQGVYV